jgi:hypothetical protein
VVIYCIDTSALIAAWYERYKPNRFPKLWSQFDGLIEARRLFSSSMVLDECSRRSPELHEWLKDRPEMFLAPDETVQVRVQRIVNTYTALVAQGKEKFAADPFCDCHGRNSRPHRDHRGDRAGQFKENSRCMPRIAGSCAQSHGADRRGRLGNWLVACEHGAGSEEFRTWCHDKLFLHS